MSDIARHKNMIDIAFKVVAAAMALFTVLVAYFRFTAATEYVNIHLFFALTLVGLDSARRWPKLWPVWTGFIVVSAIACGYVHLNMDALEFRSGYPTVPDIYVGLALIGLTLFACFWAFGPVVLVLVLVFLAYALFGYLIPGYFNTFRPELPRLISTLSTGLSGIYGPLLSSSANYIFLFIVLGSIIQITPAPLAFTQLSNMISGRFRGGPGHMPFVSSSIIGMVTGASAANIAITGAFTIPVMKKAGYDAETAGAIEAVASQGGQIMPPVLGAAAFVMAELTGVDYFDICVAAALPAVLYFLSLFINVELRARKLNIRTERVPVDYKELMLGLPFLVIPIGLLIVLMAVHYTAAFAAFWTLIVTLVMTVLSRKTRPSFRVFINGLSEGVITGVKISAVTAALGMVFTVMTSTGLGIKFPGIIAAVSDGNLWIAMTCVFLICLLLGCGLPHLAVYLITAIVAAPVVVDMGVPKLAVHLALLYFAMYAGITPPFAPGALIASQMAGGKWLQTANKSMLIGLPSLFLPFMWITNPGLIGDFANPLNATMAFIGAFGAILTLNILINGYYLRELKLGSWLLVAASFAALVLAVVTRTYTLTGVGLALLAAVTFWEYRAADAKPRVDFA